MIEMALFMMYSEYCHLYDTIRELENKTIKSVCGEPVKELLDFFPYVDTIHGEIICQIEFIGKYTGYHNYYGVTVDKIKFV